MKKVLLLVAFLVTSVSLANASRPNGPLTYNPNNHGTIDDRYVEIDVFRDYISFSFDRSVSHVCVKNINTGKSFSRYFTPATCWPGMDFEPGNGTWEVYADGLYYGRFNIGFVTWPDPFADAPEDPWGDNPWDNWGDNEGGFDYPAFDFNHGINLFPVDWFDDGNGPVFVRFHY